MRTNSRERAASGGLGAQLRIGALAAVAALLSFSAAATEIEVRLPHDRASESITGRLLVVVQKNETPQARTNIGLLGSPVFGQDVEALAPGRSVRLSETAIGWPVETLRALPPGEYYVQPVLVPYERFQRADGHVLWLPYSERQATVFAKPGNFFAPARKIVIDPKSRKVERFDLTETIAPFDPPTDTEWLKHVRIHSKILSDFWGRDIHITARVLLPKGFHDNPQARYPLIMPFGHGAAPFSFNPDPASHTERAIASARDAKVETGYEFYQQWISDGFPRMVAVTFEHPSPYFLESYAVDSANNGPYGRAFTEEIIPHLEKEFRLIGEPYARIVEGASTGGWEALALQLFYPDYFGGAWVFNPDPISFRRYQLVNIYEDASMFELKVNDYLTFDRPFRRSREGQPLHAMRDIARLEAALGSRGRSGYQLDIWQATHGPVGDDGYPALLFDKLTGEIDRDVAAYYRDNGYDLTEHLRANWPALGPKLRGKLHFFAGEMDDFYLNLAVYEFEAMIRETAPADYPIRFEYGRPKAGHNWHHTDWAGVVREVAAHIKKNAPRGANMQQWNY